MASKSSFAGSSVDVVQAPVVAVGANDGLSPLEHGRLADRQVFTIPDIIAGSGGSAAMDALFAPADLPYPHTVLESVAGTMDALSTRLRKEVEKGMTTWQAAMTMAARPGLAVDARPYGLRLLAAREEERALTRHRAAPITVELR